jgi:hypothetical protein
LQLSSRGLASKDSKQGDEEFSINRLSNRKKGLHRKTKGTSA